MKEIFISPGNVALVDDADYDALAKFKWHLSCGYACRYIGNNKHSRMHREILNAPPGTEVDHADGNRLNNQRSNIRLCNGSQNQINKGPQPCNTSGFKGVSWHKQKGRWQAQISVNGRNKYIGHYDTPADAAAAYRAEAVRLHGDFARFEHSAGHAGHQVTS